MVRKDACGRGGIGVSAAVFSALNALVQRPAPIRDPGRLIGVWPINAQGQETSTLADLLQDGPLESVCAYGSNPVGVEAKMIVCGIKSWADSVLISPKQAAAATVPPPPPTPTVKVVDIVQASQSPIRTGGWKTGRIPKCRHGATHKVRGRARISMPCRPAGPSQRS